MPSILFVCLGNICRSPAAEGVLRHLAKQQSYEKQPEIQSCGLGSWHVGNLPDIRMQESAKRRGIILASHAQQFHLEFFDHFDYILSVDQEIINTLYAHATTPEHKAKLHLITAFSTSFRNQEIPDPYYGGEASFELVLDMLEDSCEGLLQHLEKTGQLKKSDSKKS